MDSKLLRSIVGAADSLHSVLTSPYIRVDVDELVLTFIAAINKRIPVTLPHSITTWLFHSVAVNPRGGICAQPVVKVAVEKNFFLQVDMPYKVVQNEHVLIQVSIYNYRPSVMWGECPQRIVGVVL